MRNLVEFDQLITPDGLVYELNDGVTRFLIGSISGQGLPPINWIEQQGPFQDGTTIKDFRLGKRVLSMVIRENGRNRQDYWDIRSQLINYVRPNGSSDIAFSVLRKILPNGAKRDLDVLIEEGPQFQSDASRWDEWSYQTPLRFVAPDPSFYDPTAITDTFSLSSHDDLKYPVRYPVKYGNLSTIDQTLNIVYTGTYRAFPVITIVGPCNHPIITNQTTGEKIELVYSIPDGKTVTIDLRYGEKVIEDNSVPPTNLSGTTSDDSSQGTWHIQEPARGVSSKTNTIRVQASAMTPTSQITITFNTRYIGI